MGCPPAIDLSLDPVRSRSRTGASSTAIPVVTMGQSIGPGSTGFAVPPWGDEEPCA